MEKKISLAEIKAIGRARYYTRQSRTWFTALMWVVLAFVILGFCLSMPFLVKEHYPVEYTTQQGDIISIQRDYATFNGELIQKTKDLDYTNTITPLTAAGFILLGIGVVGFLVLLGIDADREGKAMRKFAQQWLDNNLKIPE